MPCNFKKLPNHCLKLGCTLYKDEVGDWPCNRRIWPLYLALVNAAGHEVVQALLQANPNAARMVDKV